MHTCSNLYAQAKYLKFTKQFLKRKMILMCNKSLCLVSLNKKYLSKYQLVKQMPILR